MWQAAQLPIDWQGRADENPYPALTSASLGQDEAMPQGYGILPQTVFSHHPDQLEMDPLSPSQLQAAQHPSTFSPGGYPDDSLSNGNVPWWGLMHPSPWSQFHGLDPPLHPPEVYGEITIPPRDSQIDPSEEGFEGSSCGMTSRSSRGDAPRKLSEDKRIAKAKVRKTGSCAPSRFAKIGVSIACFSGFVDADEVVQYKLAKGSDSQCVKCTSLQVECFPLQDFKGLAMELITLFKGELPLEGNSASNVMVRRQHFCFFA